MGATLWRGRRKCTFAMAQSVFFDAELGRYWT